jgi:hypothetical protein
LYEQEREYRADVLKTTRTLVNPEVYMQDPRLERQRVKERRVAEVTRHSPITRCPKYDCGYIYKLRGESNQFRIRKFDTDTSMYVIYPYQGQTNAVMYVEPQMLEVVYPHPFPPLDSRQESSGGVQRLAPTPILVPQAASASQPTSQSTSQSTTNTNNQQPIYDALCESLKNHILTLEGKLEEKDRQIADLKEADNRRSKKVTINESLCSANRSCSTCDKYEKETKKALHETNQTRTELKRLETRIQARIDQFRHLEAKQPVFAEYLKVASHQFETQAYLPTHACPVTRASDGCIEHHLKAEKKVYLKDGQLEDIERIVGPVPRNAGDKNPVAIFIKTHWIQTGLIPGVPAADYNNSAYSNEECPIISQFLPSKLKITKGPPAEEVEYARKH